MRAYQSETVEVLDSLGIESVLLVLSHFSAIQPSGSKVSLTCFYDAKSNLKSRFG